MNEEARNEFVDEKAIMKNMFYLDSDNPSRKVYNNNVAKVVHKSMRYMCVDGKGPQ